MGNCLGPKRQFVVNDNITGQGLAAKEIFDLLQFSKKELDELYGHFCKVDADGGGTIMNLELYFHILKDRSLFLDTVFSCFDDDRSGQLDFLEFVVSLWSLNTLSPQSIGGYAFLMCDADGSGDLSLHEITHMFEILYPNGGAQQCIVDLKNDVAFEGTLNVVEFIGWTQNKLSVMAPLLRLQATLQESFGGSYFWRQLATRRSHLEEEYLRHPKCINELRQKVRDVRDRYQELRRLTEKKKVLAVKSVAHLDPKKGKLMDKYVKMVSSGTDDLKKEKQAQEEEDKRNADPLRQAMERFKINVNDPKAKEPLPPSTAPTGTNPFRDKLFDKQEQRKDRRAKRELKRSGKSVVPVGSVEELLQLATEKNTAKPGLLSPKAGVGSPLALAARPVSASHVHSPAAAVTAGPPSPSPAPRSSQPSQAVDSGPAPPQASPLKSPPKRVSSKNKVKNEPVRPTSALVVGERERARSTKGMVGREFDNHRKLVAGPSIMILDS